MEEEQEHTEYSLTTDIHGIRGLKSALEYLMKVWPGYPARPLEEQELLWTVLDQLNRCILEHTLNEGDINSGS